MRVTGADTASGTTGGMGAAGAETWSTGLQQLGAPFRAHLLAEFRRDPLHLQERGAECGGTSQWLVPWSESVWRVHLLGGVALAVGSRGVLRRPEERTGLALHTLLLATLLAIPVRFRSCGS